MIEELERARSRLENIRSVQPILSALHSISLGSWQAALKRGAQVRRYEARLKALLPPLLPLLPPVKKPAPAQTNRTLVLAVGSERGLCGRFNVAIAERTEAHLADLAAAETQVRLAALGSRMHRLLRQRGHPPEWWRPLSITALPGLDLALELTQTWLSSYEAYDLDAVDLVYGAYRGMAGHEPAVLRLLPPHLPPRQAETGPAPLRAPIVETDPVSLYTHVMEQWTVVTLYGRLLDSAASEHAARYRIMESATQNADRLIAELTLAIQTARRGAITREMQELAVGAGLVGPREQ